MGKSPIQGGDIRKAFRYLEKNGVRHTWYAAKERLETERNNTYRYEEPTAEELENQRRQAGKNPCLISILVPAYETDDEYFRQMIESVLAQSYRNWELIIADASPFDGLKKIAKSYEDSRILYRHLDKNGGISDNTNEALRLAGGDYVGMLDHDDVLTPDALYEMVRAIEAESVRKGEEKAPWMVYSDEDKCDGGMTSFREPNRKTDFNLDLLLSNNYICHFLLLRRELIRDLKFRREYDGAQDYDLVLRAVGFLLDVSAGLPVVHVPKVLYHWRCHEASTAFNPESKKYAYEAGRKAVQMFLDSRGWPAEALPSLHLGYYRIKYRPDILSARPDVGAVGGRLLGKDHRIAGGLYLDDGTSLFQGLHKEYGGYMNRACLLQDAEAVDIRCMRVRRELWPLFEDCVGVPYRDGAEGERMFDWRRALPGLDEKQARQLSLTFCRALREKGSLVIWDPEITHRL